MKKSLNIFVLAIIIMVAQACGPKSENYSEESQASEDSIATDATVADEVALTAVEKRAKIEKETAEREEKRRIGFEALAKTTPTFTDADGNIVYNRAEVDPSYHGGKKAMMKYLRDNIKFPKEAEEKGIEGTVFVDFIVGANGVVREVGVTDAPDEVVDESFRAEAIRVVSAMPKWIPGRQHGKAVQVRYSLPVTFQMI